MKITIYGCGYVGLVSAACFAEVGYRVMCVDIDAERVARLNRGEPPIYEPGLEETLQEALRAGNIAFTTDYDRAVAHASLHMIAVGTPPDEDGSADLSHVLDVARAVAQRMEEDTIVIAKSTVPVGSCDRIEKEMRDILRQRGSEARITVVSSPEFLKEGAAMEDFRRPDRIIVGTDDENAIAVLRELYAPFSRNHEKLVVMDRRSAELTKYAANAMLATRISFMNEMARLAEKVGADIEKVRLGISADPRIGHHFLYAGCGYGGSCFPKDVRALISTARDAGVEMGILQAVQDCNEHQKEVLFEKIREFFGGDLRGRTFALWGLAFKPGTDDMREAPSRTLMERLWAEGARVRAHDPAAMEECRRIYGERDDLMLVERPMDAAQGADALVVVTEWKMYRAPDFDLLREQLRQPVVFDGRNIYSPDLLARHGIRHVGIGRASRAAS